MAICRSNSLTGPTTPNMVGMMCTHACTTTRMTCVATSKLYLRAGLHSHSTSRLGVVATPRQPGPLQYICHLLRLPLPLRRLRVKEPAPQEAVAVATGVWAGVALVVLPSAAVDRKGLKM